MTSVSTSSPEASSGSTGAHTPLTPDELAQISKCEVYDREGNTKTLGDLVEGKRSVLIFIRHFCTATFRLEISMLTRSRVLELSDLCQSHIREYTTFEATG